MSRSAPLTLTDDDFDSVLSPREAIDARAKAYGLKLSSGKRTQAQNLRAGGSPTSNHLTGRANDYAGAPEAMKAFTQEIAKNYGGSVRELYHDPVGGWKRGKSIGAIGKHSDHVHVAFDDISSTSSNQRFTLTDDDFEDAVQAPPKNEADALVRELTAANRPSPANALNNVARGVANVAAKPVAKPSPSASQPQKPYQPSAAEQQLARYFEEYKAAGNLPEANKYANELKTKYGWSMGSVRADDPSGSLFGTEWTYIKPPGSQGIENQVSQGTEAFRAVGVANREARERRARIKLQQDAKRQKQGLVANAIDAVKEAGEGTAMGLTSWAGDRVAGAGRLLEEGANLLRSAPPGSTVPAIRPRQATAGESIQAAGEKASQASREYQADFGQSLPSQAGAMVGELAPDLVLAGLTGAPAATFGTSSALSSYGQGKPLAESILTGVVNARGMEGGNVLAAELEQLAKGGFGKYLGRAAAQGLQNIGTNAAIQGDLPDTPEKAAKEILFALGFGLFPTGHPKDVAAKQSAIEIATHPETNPEVAAAIEDTVSRSPVQVFRDIDELKAGNQVEQGKAIAPDDASGVRESIPKAQAPLIDSPLPLAEKPNKSILPVENEGVKVDLSEIAPTEGEIVSEGAQTTPTAKKLINERRKAERERDTDTLTGIQSQGAYKRAEAAINEDPNRAVVAIDLNSFKAVNDTYGHGAGDRVLQNYAKELQKALPDAQMIARSGGDEMRVVVDKKDAQKATEIIRAIKVKEGDIEVTGSVGHGMTEADADAASLAHKAELKKANLIGDRGEAPPKAPAKKTIPAGTDIVQAIRAKGGMKMNERTGEQRRLRESKLRQPGVFNKKGISYDDMAQALYDDGFLTEPSTDELFIKLDEAAAGKKIYSVADEGILKQQQQAIDDEWDAFGRAEDIDDAGKQEYAASVDALANQRLNDAVSRIEKEGADEASIRQLEDVARYELGFDEDHIERVINAAKSAHQENTARSFESRQRAEAKTTPANQTSQRQSDVEAEAPTHHSQTQPRADDGKFVEQKERSLPKTLEENQLPSGDSLIYDVIGNDESVKIARENLASKGVDGAAEMVRNSTDMSAETTATGLAAISEYQKAGDFEKANALASDLSAMLTRAGQSIQAVKVIAKFSPERALITAQKLAEKAGKKVTALRAEDITKSASKIQAAEARVKELEAIVADFEAKAKKKSESQRAKVIKQLDVAEQAARERLSALNIAPRTVRTSPSQQGSISLKKTNADPQTISDLAFILAAKAAKGDASLADIRKELSTEFGDVYDANYRQIERAANRILKEVQPRAEKRQPTPRQELKKEVAAADKWDNGIKEGAKNNPDDMAAVAASLLADGMQKGKSRLFFEKEMKAKFGDEYNNKNRDSIYKDAYSKIQEAKRTHRELGEIYRAMREGAVTGEQIKIVNKRLDEARKAHREANLELSRHFDSLGGGRRLRLISDWRKAGLLSSVRTHARNFISNTAYQAFDEFSRVPAVVADFVASKATGQRSITGLSPSASLDSVIAAFTTGWGEAKSIMNTGVTPDEAAKLQIPQESNSGIKIIDVATNTVFRAMAASDRIFYNGALKRNLIDRAKVQALNEAREGKIKHREVDARKNELVKAPSDELLADAKHDALIATFNNNNLLSNKIRLLRADLRPSVNFAIDLVMPFDRTPTNVIARVLEASPLGFAKSANIAAKSLMNKAMSVEEQRQFSQTFGRATTGTALMTLGWVLGAKGLMSAYYDEDEDFKTRKENRKNKEAGKSPMAIKIGNQWVTIGDTNIGNMLAIGATLQKEMGEAKDGTGKAIAPLKTAYQVLSEQPLLGSAKDLFKAGGDIQGKGANYAGRLGASFVPGSAFVRDIATATDDKARKTFGLGGQLKASIPGLRQSLPEDLGVQHRRSWAIDPFRMTTDKERKAARR